MAYVWIDNLSLSLSLSLSLFLSLSLSLSGLLTRVWRELFNLGEWYVHGGTFCLIRKKKRKKNDSIDMDDQ